MPGVDAAIIGFLVFAILLLGGLIMSQLDDLKAAQAETIALLGTVATELAEIATDLDTLIAAVPPDLTEVLEQAQSIRDGVKAQADAATAAAGKFTPPAV